MQLVNGQREAGSFPPAVQLAWTRRVALAGAAAVLALIALHVVNTATVGVQLFDLNEEQNLPSWASSFGFTLAGLAGLTIGLGERAMRPWLAIGALMLAFSLDDVAMLHERFEKLSHEGAALLVIEPLFVLGFVVVFVAAVRTLAGRLPRLLFAGAILALVLAQVASSAGFVREHVPVPLGVIVVFEEGAELAVSALLLAAMTQPLLARVRAILLRERAIGQSTQGRACLTTSPPSASTLNSTSMAKDGSPPAR
jgi:hypothetical protein